MHIASNPVSPIRPVGSNTDITVYLDLSMWVNISVTVSTTWSGPKGHITKTIATLFDNENTTTSAPTYTSTISVRNFQLIHSGLYKCVATILFSFSRLSDGNLNSTTAIITVGKLE